MCNFSGGRVEPGPTNPKRGWQPSPSLSVAPRVKEGVGKHRAASPLPLLPARAPWGPEPRRSRSRAHRRRRKVWGPGAWGRRRPLPDAQLLPWNIPASAAPGDGGGFSPRSAPAPAGNRGKCGGGAGRRGVPLGAAGGARQAGWRRRADPSRRSGQLPAPPCAARRRSEPRRRRSAEPGAARAGEAGSRRGSERYPVATDGRARSRGGSGRGGRVLPGRPRFVPVPVHPPPRGALGCGSSSSPL